VDGLYTRSHDVGAHYGANIQPFTTGVTLSNVQASDKCFDAVVNASGQNNTATPVPTAQRLCYLKSATFNNIVSNQTTQARDITGVNKSIGGGFKVDQDGVKANLDVSYQNSRNDRTLIIMDVGQRLTSLTLTPDVDGIAQMTVPGGALLSSANLSMRNSFQQ